MKYLIIILSALLASLLGCSSNDIDDPGSGSWLTFEKTIEGPTVFRFTLGADGQFLSSVATLPYLELPDGPEGDLLSAGPRLVGALDGQEMETLVGLLGAERQRAYQPDACHDEEGCGEGPRYRLVVTADVAQVPAMAAKFAEDGVGPATRAMLEGVETIMQRSFQDGVPFNESDEARANEREWPRP